MYFTFLRNHKISTSKILAFGYHGTNVNTGWKNGVIKQMEEEMQSPLQWLICLLHANELPLRRIFTFLDGPTSGPKAFSGPIGKNLGKSTTLNVVKFKPISTDLPPITSDLRTDQKYLYKMCQIVSSGFCSNAVANMDPGNVSYSRWLTTANHILRTYIGTKQPSKNLVIMATYVMKVNK